MLHRLSQRVRFSVRATDPAAEAADGDIGDEPYQLKMDYGMDRVSNREEVTETPYQGQGTTTYYTTNSVNAYTQIGAEYRTHDANGNLTCDGTRYFGYDFRNNLVNVLTVASFEFDALNRRTKKYVNATSATTRCIYDGQSLIEEYDGSDNLIHLFVNGQQIDEPRVMIGPDYADVDGDENTTEEVRLYFHADQVGSIVAVTGPDETVVEQYEYMPYGAVTIKDGQGTDLNGSSAILNPFMFTARRFDEETGLYHYRHRAYDPVAGRFLQRDPLGYVDGPNLLEYAKSSPSQFADPLGLSARSMVTNLARKGEAAWRRARAAGKTDAEAFIDVIAEISYWAVQWIGDPWYKPYWTSRQRRFNIILRALGVLFRSLSLSVWTWSSPEASDPHIVPTGHGRNCPDRRRRLQGCPGCWNGFKVPVSPAAVRHIIGGLAMGRVFVAIGNAVGWLLGWPSASSTPGDRAANTAGVDLRDPLEDLLNDLHWAKEWGDSEKAEQAKERFRAAAKKILCR